MNLITHPKGAQAEQIHIHGDRYIDTRAKDTDTSAGLAVAWLKRVGGGGRS